MHTEYLDVLNLQFILKKMGLMIFKAYTHIHTVLSPKSMVVFIIAKINIAIILWLSRIIMVHTAALNFTASAGIKLLQLEINNCF